MSAAAIPAGKDLAYLTIDGENVMGPCMLADRARRLAACWNAFKGIETENIEGLTLLGEQARIDANVASLQRELAAARPAIDACAGVPSFLLLPGSVRRQIDELAAAYALLGDILVADDEARQALADIGLGVEVSTSDAMALTERIRALLKGSQADKRADNITHDEVVDAAAHAIGLAAGAGMVLTIWQDPIKPLAMGNYSTRFELRESRAVYGPRLTAEAEARAAAEKGGE